MCNINTYLIKDVNFIIFTMVKKSKDVYFKINGR